MLFHEDNFTEVLNRDQANIVAKLCNQLINSNARVFYGTMFADGSGKEFSTDKKPQDTHVMLGVNASLMGSLAPSDVSIALDKPSKEDHERAMADRVRQLERELRIERSKNNG